MQVRRTAGPAQRGALFLPHDVREINAAGATHDREHEAFGKELSEQLRASRPQRRAYRDFALAHSAARQQQIGDIHATDQKQKAHRSQQQPEIPDRCGWNKIVLQWFGAGTEIFVALRELGRQLPSQHLHFRVRLLDRHAVHQPPHHTEKMILVIDHLWFECQWNHEL